MEVVAPSLAHYKQPAAEVIEGIAVSRFALRRAEGGTAGWLREYAQALWRIRQLARRRAGNEYFDVIHLANPPDVLSLAVLRERRRGSAVIFDQHDLMPEMAAQRFGSRGRPLERALVATERLAHRVADVSIVANESFRRVAVERGRRASEDVAVVRNGPRLESFTPEPPNPALSKGRAHLLVYEGLMGPLDGVDHALHALASLRDRRGDWHALFLGDGEALPALRALAAELDLDGHVDFPGYVSDRRMREAICTASVCLVPDPRNPLTDKSTLIKVAEYMAMGGAIAAYPLSETKTTAGAAAAYAGENDPADLARVIDELLDDPERRERMGREGMARVREGLAWEHSERELLRAYDRALEKAAARSDARKRR